MSYDRRLHSSRSYLGDTDDHVLDVGAQGADACKLLAVSEPHIHSEAVLAHSLNGDIDVAEVTLQGAAWALDDDLAGVHLDGDCKNCQDNPPIVSGNTYHPSAR